MWSLLIQSRIFMKNLSSLSVMVLGANMPFLCKFDDLEMDFTVSCYGTDLYGSQICLFYAPDCNRSVSALLGT